MKSKYIFLLAIAMLFTFVTCKKETKDMYNPGKEEKGDDDTSDLGEAVFMVETAECTAFSQNEATVKSIVKVSGNVVLRDFGVVYGISTSEDISKRVKANKRNEDGMFSVDLTSLELGTKYYYRAYAVVNDSTIYGDFKSFKTVNEGEPSFRNDEPKCTFYSITVSTNYFFTEDLLSQLRSYGFCYATHENPTVSDEMRKITTPLTDKTGNYSYSVKHLQGGATYYFRPFVITGSEIFYGPNQKVSAKTDESSLTLTPTTGYSYKLEVNGVDKNFYSAMEIGVCYKNVGAGTSELPTINDKVNRAYTISTPIDMFHESMDLTFDFEQSSSNYNVYVLRPYAKVDGVVHYGAALNKPIMVQGAVDMGVSVYWADCNLGASSPEECGGYYAWGETSTKSNYIWGNYAHGTENNIRKYNEAVNNQNKTVELGKMDDAATVKKGSVWRIPTAKEIEELTQNCDIVWSDYNGCSGYTLTSRITKNVIFIPAWGYMDGASKMDDYANNRQVYIWSSTLSKTDISKAQLATGGYTLSATSGLSVKYELSRQLGVNIRPVCVKLK